MEKPVRLFTGYLHGRKKETPKTVDGRLSFAIQVAVKTPVYEIDNRFWFNSHYEGKDILNETIVISVTEGESGRVYYQTSTMQRPKLLEQADAGRYRIPLFPRGKPPGGSEDRKPPESFWGALLLDVSSWNE